MKCAGDGNFEGLLKAEEMNAESNPGQSHPCEICGRRVCGTRSSARYALTGFTRDAPGWETGATTQANTSGVVQDV